MRQWLLNSVIFAGALAVTSTASIAEVVLTSKDGSSSLRGTIISADEDTYQIETTIGTLLVNARLIDCTGEECPNFDPADQLIRVAGPGSLLSGLMPHLIDRYAAEAEAESVDSSDAAKIALKSGDTTMVTFDMDSTSMGDAFQALLDGEAEIVVSDRPVSDREIDAFVREGLGDLTTPQRESIVALDGISPLISPQNSIDRLDMEQVMGVFAGEITNWSQVGGADAPINVYLPDDGSTLATSFELALLDPEFLSFTPQAQRLETTAAVSEAVANDPNGIGLASRTDVGEGQQLSMVASCGLAVRQDRFAIKAEDYPFARRIYLYTAERDLPSRVQKFVTSTAAAADLSDLGLIDLEPEVASIGDHGNQLAYALADRTQLGELDNLRNFAQTVLDAGRLSITFRFATGSSRLENKAAADAARLANLLSDAQLAGREVLLVGFTDSIGSSDVNRLLSLRRAQQVLDEIVTQGGGGVDVQAVRTLGFGAAFPVACNTNEAGRQMNRRVEVWVR